VPQQKKTRVKPASDDAATALRHAMESTQHVLELDRDYVRELEDAALERGRLEREAAARWLEAREAAWRKAATRYEDAHSAYLEASREALGEELAAAGGTYRRASVGASLDHAEAMVAADRAYLEAVEAASAEALQRAAAAAARRAQALKELAGTGSSSRGT
jgi:hypothetical protein